VIVLDNRRQRKGSVDRTSLSKYFERAEGGCDLLTNHATRSEDECATASQQKARQDHHRRLSGSSRHYDDCRLFPKEEVS
jgi:hypothetical protein